MTSTVVGGGYPSNYVVQQPNVVTPDETHPSARHRQTFRGLGIAQIVLGTISLILGIVIFIHPIYYIGSGVWGGVWFIACGGLNVSIGNKARYCNVVASMIMGIFAILVGVISGIWDALLAASWSTPTYLRDSVEFYVAIFTILSLLAFVQMVFAIILSAFCCMGTCGARDTQGQVLGPYIQTIPPPLPNYGPQQRYEQPTNSQVFTNIGARPPLPAPPYEDVYEVYENEGPKHE